MSVHEGSVGSEQFAADVNARLWRDFPTLEPAIRNVVQRDIGEARMAVGLLSLTRKRPARDGGALPDTSVQTQTAAVYLSDTLRFPRFDLLPDNAALKLVEGAVRGLFGIGDFGKIDFTSHPAFARRYRVAALDTDGTRWLFEDRVLALLAGSEGLSISASNGSLLLYRADARLSAGQLAAFHNEAAGVFRAFETAARRPGAFNSATRAPVSEVELFAEKLPAAFGKVRLSPAVTFADAEAFIRQSPPRAITPGVARYVEQRSPFLVGVVGGAFAAGGAFFTLLGWQKWQWFEMILLWLFLAGGAGGATWFILARLRVRHLLRRGRMGTARIDALRDVKSRVDGETEYRLELQFDAGGTQCRASCPVPAAAVDRLQAIAAEKRTIPILYDASNPERVLVADALVMETGIG